MGINKELNEGDLENVIGSSIPSKDLPDKFKKYGKRDELSEDDLESVLGGPFKAEDLPDWAYTDKNDDFTIEDDGTIVRR